MDSKIINIIILSGSLIVAWHAYKKNKNRKRKKLPQFRVNPYLMERNQKARFFQDFEDLKKHNIAFTENFHMSITAFENIFSRIEERLEAVRHTRKDQISSKEKFAAVIEYLASGSLQRHIAFNYRTSKQHFGTILLNVCEAIIEGFVQDMPKMNANTYENVAYGFEKYWQFPHCVGAIDGKHIAIKAPAHSGSLYYNYKGFFSIVLIAACDANYKFTYFDIGAFGSECDANIFISSQFGKKVASDDIDFPSDKDINGEAVPFFFVGDGAFPLGKRMMKPFAAKRL